MGIAAAWPRCVVLSKTSACPMRRWGSVRRTGRSAGTRLRPDHDAPGLEFGRYVQGLIQIAGGCLQARTQIGFVAVGGKGDAVHRAYVHAAIALDAQIAVEDRLHITIQTAAGALSLERRGGVKPQLHFHANIGQAPRQRPRAPLKRTSLETSLRSSIRGCPSSATTGASTVRALRHGFAVQEAINRYGRLVPLCHGRDDVLGAQCRIPAKEHVGQGGLEGRLAQHRQAPFVECNAAVTLNPGKCVSCPTATSTSSHATNTSGSPVGTRLRRPLASYSAYDFKRHARQAPIVMFNVLGTWKFRMGMPSCWASSFPRVRPSFHRNHCAR